MIHVEITDGTGAGSYSVFTTAIRGKATASPCCPHEHQCAEPESLIRWEVVGISRARRDERRLALLARSCMEGVIRMKAKHETWFSAVDDWLWTDTACGLKARCMSPR
ncbi:MAG TPA: hypothetical protein PKD61_03730 [Polyangiaceae bacterium]|nr:hypothetical protein [Polyangiaceae bacterium]